MRLFPLHHQFAHSHLPVHRAFYEINARGKRRVNGNLVRAGALLLYWQRQHATPLQIQHFYLHRSAFRQDIAYLHGIRSRIGSKRQVKIQPLDVRIRSDVAPGRRIEARGSVQAVFAGNQRERCASIGHLQAIAAEIFIPPASVRERRLHIIGRHIEVAHHRYIHFGVQQVDAFGWPLQEGLEIRCTEDVVGGLQLDKRPFNVVNACAVGAVEVIPANGFVWLPGSLPRSCRPGSS